MGLSLLKCLSRDLRFGRTRPARGVHPRAFSLPATWDERIALALASPDNAMIPRHPLAGRVEDGTQVMHNGLRVRVDGYYGGEVTRMLEVNRGVHEPQEERAFHEVLPHVREGAWILELGAYWGFYSAWFLSRVAGSRAVLVEPEEENQGVGRANLALNGVEDRATFVRAYVGSMPRRHRPPGARGTSVDALVRERGVARGSVLHADVQGAERAMLLGAAESLGGGAFDWIFLSTHTMHLHAWCRRWLAGRGWRIVAEADLPESYSYDGMLVAKRPGAPGPDRIVVSQRAYPGM